MRSLDSEVKDTEARASTELLVWAGKGAQVFANLIANLTKARKPLLLGAVEISRISEAVMNPTHGPRENGTDLASVVADGKHVIEGLAGEFVNVFGAMSVQIDADLAHDGDGLGADGEWLDTSAEDLETVAGVMAKQPFSHLAARRVTGTEDQDSWLRHICF